MGKRKKRSDRQGFNQDNPSCYNQRFTKPNRNFTRRKERDHTAGSLIALDPTGSSVVIDPAQRDLVARPHHCYRLQPQRIRLYDSEPPVFSPYVYGAYGDPSYAYGPHAYTPQGFGAHYPPSNGSAPCGPPHGTEARGYLHCDVRDPGPLSHGLGVHDSLSYGVGAITPSLKFPAVSLRGLSSNCKEVDIIKFFHGLHVVDVFINKTFPEEAFVVFPNSIVADSALQRDRKKLGGASVEIFTCRKQDYYDAVTEAVNGVDFVTPRAQAKSPDCLLKHTHDVKSNAVAESKPLEHLKAKAKSLIGNNQAKHTCHIVKIRGPPYFADKKVIVGVFGECDLSEDRVHCVINPDGNPTGEVLLELISQEDAKKALSKDKIMIGSHRIEILPSTLEDLQAASTEEWRHEHDCLDGVKESNNMEGKYYTQTLKLRNVPPSADMCEIIEFFGEFNLTLDRLQVVCRRDGIATGEVYVEFNSVEDAKKAMSKDKEKILSQCVELAPSSPNEASRAMARSG
uniref:RRM domain-containing protein n=1 Tax=Kalanchoe fedtschenkoi TaxID=63787 RepID=A0A7N0UUX4_KALFE